jgi:hypothetical protein
MKRFLILSVFVLSVFLISPTTSDPQQSSGNENNGNTLLPWCQTTVAASERSNWTNTHEAFDTGFCVETALEKAFPCQQK